MRKEPMQKVVQQIVHLVSNSLANKCVIISSGMEPIQPQNNYFMPKVNKNPYLKLVHVKGEPINYFYFEYIT